MRLLTLLALLAVTAVALPAQARPLYKDPSRPVDARVNDLLSRMTLEEKVAQMEGLQIFGPNLDSLLNGTGSQAIYGAPGRRLSFGAIANAGRANPRERAERVNTIQRYFVEGTRLGIPILITDEALHGVVGTGLTNYPTPLAFASTWNTDLVHEVFTQIGLEAASIGTNLVLAPVLDVAQDQRWGRVEETYGEDPYLNGRMGVAAITGLQGTVPGTPFRGIDRDHVAATTKHFAAHGTGEGGRNIGPAHISEHEFRSVHLRPFEMAVKEAQALAVMPAYHEIFGVPVHASTFVLTDILRTEWGFQGITVSDFFGVRYNFDTHRVAADSAEAARLAAVAGVDIDMPQLASYQKLVEVVRSGRMPEAMVDRAVKRVLRAKFVLGLFENPYVDPERAARVVTSAPHIATARKVGQQGIVLLKNEGNILPLNPATTRSIALIGPHADFAEAGNYAGVPVPAQRITAVAAIKERLPNARVMYAEGVRLLARNQTGPSGAFGPAGQGGGRRWTDDSTNYRLMREAIDSAKQADVVVLFLGATARMMHEAWGGNDGDNDDLELKTTQNALADSIRALAAAQGKPVVTILFSGGALMPEHVATHMPALLYAWYLGQETGHAVSDVLFGDVNPSAHLPITIGRNVGQLPVYYNHAPSARRSNYLLSNSTPLFPFGFGLSYTTFAFSDVKLARETIARTDSVQVSVTVQNTGARAGDAVVQVYVRQDNTLPTRPVKELAGFRRVALEAGETKTVTLWLGPQQLGHVGMNNRWVVDPGTIRVMVGSSSRNEDLSTVTLTVR